MITFLIPVSAYAQGGFFPTNGASYCDSSYTACMAALSTETSSVQSQRCINERFACFETSQRIAREMEERTQRMVEDFRRRYEAMMERTSRFLPPPSSPEGFMPTRTIVLPQDQFERMRRQAEPINRTGAGEVRREPPRNPEGVSRANNSQSWLRWFR